MPRTKALTIASGIALGGFLFLRFSLFKYMDLSGWEWYQGAALLSGIGLAGIFPRAQLSAAISLGMAPLLIAIVQTFLEISRDPTCCNLWPLGLAVVFVFCFPAPLIGSGISCLLVRTRLPRMVYFVPLMSGLLIGAIAPNIQKAQKHRLETEKIPALLKQIYDAEMVYRARQPNENFACDGTLLPGAAGKLGWSHTIGKTINNLLSVQHYSVIIDCATYRNPHSFRLRAFSHDYQQPGPTFSIDETGKLTVSKE